MATSTFQADDGNHYEELSGALGSGGQGTVHRGRRAEDGTLVAIKRVHDASPDIERNRELQIALKVGQRTTQHLLAPFTWAADGDDLLLVMPLADRSLADELADHPEGLSEETQLAILRDVTTGLVELQLLGIVHRDFKPHNVLLLGGRWHVADFGMSRDLDVSTATVTFQYGGTALYVAPERWRGQPATHKSDLYALGCIAHELGTGKPPFTGTDATALRHQHWHAEPPPSPVGPTLARWIMRLLDKEPARRPQDAQAALTALPTFPPLAGELAAAAQRLQQCRLQEAAIQGQALTIAETHRAERTQALADLADICASAAESAQRQLSDLKWDNHGDVQRFRLDGIRLDITLWGQTERWGQHEELVLAGDVFTVIHTERRRVANVVCENNQGRLTWQVDRVTGHPLLRADSHSPRGFAEREFFDNYEAFRRGGTHPWVRERQALAAETIINILTELLKEAARP